MQLRAEYYLMGRDNAVSLRAEAGGVWTPTQFFSGPSALYGDGSTYEGAAQSADLTVGVTAMLRPWRAAAFSPYVVTGIAAVQSWTRGHAYYMKPDGSPATTVPQWISGTRGDLASVVGFGLATRLGGRVVQLEARRLTGGRSYTRAITVGTAVRF